jgi:hypothetical protein
MVYEGPDSDTPRKCRVVSEYRSAYPEPFVVLPGEELTAGEKDSEWPGWVWCTNRDGESRWVPEAYVQRQGQICIALRAYDATELTVRAGEDLIAGEEASGWIWCTNREGQSGWVPAEHLSHEPSSK